MRAARRAIRQAHVGARQGNSRKCKGFECFFCCTLTSTHASVGELHTLVCTLDDVKGIAMAITYEHTASNWQLHKMGPSSGNSAFVDFESPESEIQEVQSAISVLRSRGVLPSANYSLERFDAFATAVEENFEIPWTGISPRMRRTIYAINALATPKHLVCAGVFCGYTFICNAGASLGPGACYDTSTAVGLEILPNEAERARMNVERFAPGHGSSIICDDAVQWLKHDCSEAIDLLYIDAKSIAYDPATAPPRESERKSDYLRIIEHAMPWLHPGSIVLAHNSVNARTEIQDYLDYVRGPEFRISINLIIDDAGLEVSMPS